MQALQEVVHLSLIVLCMDTVAVTVQARDARRAAGASKLASTDPTQLSADHIRLVHGLEHGSARILYLWPANVPGSGYRALFALYGCVCNLLHAIERELTRHAQVPVKHSTSEGSWRRPARTHGHRLELVSVLD